MGKNLLYVTFQGKDSTKGLSYVIDLARVMGKGIAVLVFKKRRLLERFEDLMVAITFAEAGEHEFAKEMLRGDKKDIKIDDIINICKAHGVTPSVYTASEDIASTLKGIIRKDRSIDMIFLSPEVTNGALSMRDLKRLLGVSLPIVTLTSKAKINSNEIT